MSFSRTLHELAGSISNDLLAREAQTHMHATRVIAHHAPHVLRRLAEIATVFDVPELRSGQGAILACRSNAEGYRAVEYDAPGLAVAFDVRDGSARLSWRAGDTTADHPIDMETADTVIDAMLLDAVSAYVKWRIAHTHPLDMREA